MKIQMDYATFKVMTGLPKNPNKRGSKIRHIDDSFKAYEQAFDTADGDGKIQLTLDLFTACKDWLKVKLGKSDTSKGLFGTKINEMLVRRRLRIRQLADQCLDALQALDPDLLAESTFNRRKINALASPGQWHQAKHLSGGYMNERLTWMRSGKTRAFAGSDVHPTLSSEYKKKNFDTLSVQDYEKIANRHNSGKVRYLRKSHRLQYMAEPGDDGLFRRPNDDTLLDSGTNIGPTNRDMFDAFFGSQRQLWMYAMDSYGNLITREEEKRGTLAPDGLSFFNHSSFNSGREVTSAGLLLFQGGKLRWIDNNSGHYKPSAENLRNCVTLLFGEGADLSETCVGSLVFSNGRMSAIDVWSAGTYLAGTTIPDIGRLD